MGPNILHNLARACSDLSLLLFLQFWSWSNGTWKEDLNKHYLPMNLTHEYVLPNLTAQVCLEPTFISYV